MMSAHVPRVYACMYRQPKESDANITHYSSQ
jgi:hypothetical protein